MTDHPREASTAQQNHLTVVLNLNTGDVRVLSDAESAIRANEAVRDAQARSGVRLLASSAA